MTASTRETRLEKLRSMTREEALVGYTHSERRAIFALEQIASGTAGRGPTTDLEIARETALHALEDLGWPTVRDVKGAAA